MTLILGKNARKIIKVALPVHYKIIAGCEIYNFSSYTTNKYSAKIYRKANRKLLVFKFPVENIHYFLNCIKPPSDNRQLFFGRLLISSQVGENLVQLSDAHHISPCCVKWSASSH